MHPFDRHQHNRQRTRAAQGTAWPDFLLTEAVERCLDRLADIARNFPLVLNLGAHNGALTHALNHHPRIGRTLSAERNTALLAHAPTPKLAADEELLPFADNSFDAVISLLSLHAVNDLPGTLAQIERILKPDGMFLAILPGGDTLTELRHAFASAESALTGGIRPRVAPFIDVRDGGALLQRAGFALPVVDSDTIMLSYAHPLALMHELRAMGEANMLRERTRSFTPRGLVAATCDTYISQHADAEGRIPATLELITLTAWKQSPNQQQPLTPGSAKASLKNALI